MSEERTVEEIQDSILSKGFNIQVYKENPFKIKVELTKYKIGSDEVESSHNYELHGDGDHKLEIEHWKIIEQNLESKPIMGRHKGLIYTCHN